MKLSNWALVIQTDCIEVGAVDAIAFAGQEMLT
jgi:hypothetical protein